MKQNPGMPTTIQPRISTASKLSNRTYAYDAATNIANYAYDEIRRPASYTYLTASLEQKYDRLLTKQSQIYPPPRHPASKALPGFWGDFVLALA